MLTTQGTTNLQIKVDLQTKDRAEKIAQNAGFDNLASAVRFILTHMARNEAGKAIEIFAAEIDPETDFKYSVMAQEAEDDFAAGRIKPAANAQELFRNLGIAEENYLPQELRKKTKKASTGKSKVRL